MDVCILPIVIVMVMVLMMKMQDEWVCILPIVIHRILTQYQDIQNYKKVSLHLLTNLQQAQ